MIACEARSSGGTSGPASEQARASRAAARALGDGVYGAAAWRTIRGRHTLLHEAAQDVQKDVIDGFARVVVLRRDRQRDMGIILFRAGFISHNGNGLKPALRRGLEYTR